MNSILLKSRKTTALQLLKRSTLSLRRKYTDDDSKKVLKHTSRCRQEQLTTLKIRYVNSALEGITHARSIEDVALPEDTERILLPNVHIGPKISDIVLSKNQQKFYNRVVQLYEFVDEP